MRQFEFDLTFDITIWIDITSNATYISEQSDSWDNISSGDNVKSNGNMLFGLKGKIWNSNLECALVHRLPNGEWMVGWLRKILTQLIILQSIIQKFLHCAICLKKNLTEFNWVETVGCMNWGFLLMKYDYGSAR